VSEVSEVATVIALTRQEDYRSSSPGHPRRCDLDHGDHRQIGNLLPGSPALPHPSKKFFLIRAH
jgi:hypothetical protein